MRLQKRLIRRDGLGVLPQFLVAAGDAELDLDAAILIGPDGQSLLVEGERLCIVGGFLRTNHFGRLEVGVGEFQVDRRDLVLALGGEQEFHFLFIDVFGRLEVAEFQECGRLAKLRAASPGAIAMIALDRGKSLQCLAMFAAEVKCSALQVNQVVRVLRLVVFGGEQLIDLGRRLVELAVLHQLAHVLRDPCRVGGSQQGQAGQSNHAHAEAFHDCFHGRPPSSIDSRSFRAGCLRTRRVAD